VNSHQRLLAAFRLQPVDRLPIQVRGVRAWDRQWCETRDASYGPIIEAVAEHGDYVDSWGFGFGEFCSAASLAGETWTEDRADWIGHYRLVHTPGGDLRSMHLSSKTGMPGMQMEFMVKTLEDLEAALAVPYQPILPDVAGYFAKEQEMGESGVVLCSLTSPIQVVHNLMGSEPLAIWSLTDRERVLELLWTMQGRIVETLKHLLAQGVRHFAMLGEEYVTPPLHSATDFRAFAVEPEVEIGRLIHEVDGLLHLHSHGPLTAVLEDFIEIGANCLHPLEAPPMGDVTLEEAKRRIGHAICLEGNIQIGDLYAGNTENIVAQVRHNRQVTGDQGYILCPTASPHTPVLSELTVRNYLAMIRAGVE